MIAFRLVDFLDGQRMMPLGAICRFPRRRSAVFHSQKGHNGVKKIMENMFFRLCIFMYLYITIDLELNSKLSDGNIKSELFGDLAVINIIISVTGVLADYPYSKQGGRLS